MTTERISDPNPILDTFRTTFEGGQVLMTGAIANHPERDSILWAVQNFDGFEEGDGVRDFGGFEIGRKGEPKDRAIWQIDSYSADMETLCSPLEPSAVLILTIMMDHER